MELQIIQQKIYDIRGCRVMLDFDLASLYDVETRTLKQAVRRNLSRFPNDFMFQLKKDEWTELITICDKLPESVKYSPALPMAFTEQGVAMLSSVLRSPIAIEINISIMRAFVLMREMALGYDELLKRIEQLEISTNAQFSEIYHALTELMKNPEKVERNPIGYKSVRK
ncbi:ORF6N domain-containing protein [uncultured Draconibacterium sp.]|uniref:ORF6N domain-containing protein n=1 Tax=uncultured Draconibacterium sp. TaxID=1573823 RepID=UPI0025CEFED8|nr:ORF6N domain-containing protein [uncultured Draconibacterium sp.]